MNGSVKKIFSSRFLLQFAFGTTFYSFHLLVSFPPSAINPAERPKNPGNAG